MLQDKLEAALAEAHRAQSESVTDVRWRGAVLQVKNEKVKTALATAAEKSRQLNDVAAAASHTGGEDGQAGGPAAVERLYLECLACVAPLPPSYPCPAVTVCTGPPPAARTMRRAALPAPMW